MKSTDFRRARHCVFILHVHLVFVTKYRRKFFTNEILKELKTIFENVCHTFEDDFQEFNEESDHIHLILVYPPKVSISKFVSSLKGVSSRLIRKKNYSTIQKALYGDQLWSPSYFASSCGGAPLSVIKKYIEKQTKPI